MRSPVFLQRILPVFVLLGIVAGIILAGCTGLPGGNTGSSPRNNTTGDLRAYFLDVGQGDSSLILFRDKVILIDAGEIEEGGRVVSDLQKLGVKKIDLLVATHLHSDHIGGMQDVLARFPVGKVLDSGIPSSSVLYERFLDTVDKKNIPYTVAEPGQTIDLDPSLGILVLSPPKNRTGDDINTNSIVLRISFGTFSILYTGDATIPAEEVMAKNGYPLDADILKVSHHGSSDAGSAEFLRRVSPGLAVISLGKENDYGHPHRETLERLGSAASRILRTDRDGTVLVESNGATYSFVTEKDTAGFWSRPVTSPATPAGTTEPLSPAATGTTTPAVPFSLPVTIPPAPSDFTVPLPSLTIPSLQVGNASSVHISAVRFNAPGDDTKNLNGEWVRVSNQGGDAVLLTSWTLSDRDSGEPYRFPAFLLLPGYSVTVYTGSGVLNDTALFMGRTEPLWGNSGDLATLKDGSGNIIDQQTEAVTP